MTRTVSYWNWLNKNRKSDEKKKHKIKKDADIKMIIRQVFGFSASVKVKEGNRNA